MILKMSQLGLNTWSVRILLVFGFLFSFSGWSDCTKRDRLRFQMVAGETFCLHQPMKSLNSLVVSYIVLDSTQGPLSIDFLLYEPHGGLVQTIPGKSNGSVAIPIVTEAQEGDYEICFYNSYHLLSFKMIAVSVWSVPSWKKGNEPEWARSFGNSTPLPEDDYHVQVHDIEVSLDKVRVNADEVIVFQTEHQEREKQGRSIGEHNHDRVNFWSFLFSCAMIIVGIIQVVIVKGFFDLDKGPKFWNFWREAD